MGPLEPNAIRLPWQLPKLGRAGLGWPGCGNPEGQVWGTGTRAAQPTSCHGNRAPPSVSQPRLRSGGIWRGQGCPCRGLGGGGQVSRAESMFQTSDSPSLVLFGTQTQPRERDIFITVSQMRKPRPRAGRVLSQLTQLGRGRARKRRLQFPFCSAGLPPRLREG